jgi:hypothetical protein
VEFSSAKSWQTGGLAALAVFGNQRPDAVCPLPAHMPPEGGWLYADAPPDPTGGAFSVQMRPSTEFLELAV